MTKDEFLSRLRAEGFAEPVAVERDAGYRLDLHDHPFEAYALITEGELSIEVDGVATAYPAGSTFRLAPHTPHREWAGAAGARYLSGRRESAKGQP
ncbi:cupin domain-containing protein [Ramlibacter rhizophilus]|uniref:Cupin domain-containing protein n=1 Tax=Ramlibacter rhizophilus TaxID=1781167 RepID=A0A4Z0BJZ0_9BURK|nr:cupin domain-containing protein [Ramlibacter rhizophilus]TFY98733.1 cupin domain-containing protein [Ramlibacter rhizophilus]